MNRAVTGLVVGVLLVSSTVAATTTGGTNAAATGDASLAVDQADAEANVTSGAIRWTNQTLYFRAATPEDDAGKTYEIRRVVDGAVGPLLTQFVLDDGGEALLRTSGVPSGEYAIVDEEGRPLRVNADGVSTGPTTVANGSWELFGQTLQATANPTEIVRNETGSVRIDSNRGRYELRVTSPDVSVGTLAAILGGGERIDTDGNGVADTVRISATATTTRSIRIPAEVPGGDIDLRFAVPDTDVADNVTITVREQPRRTVEFDTLAKQADIGDVTTLTMQLERTRTATVRIGSRSQGYLTRLDVVDGNGDGEVTVRMNTYYAGRVPEASGRVFGTAAEADRIVNVTRLTPRRGSLLARGEYVVNATVDGREVGASTMILTSRSKATLTTMAAPSQAAVDSLERIRDGTSSQDRIATGDKLVLRVETTGLGGFFNASYDLSKGSADAEEHGIHLTLTEQGTNRQLDVGSADLVTTTDSSTIYAVFDTETVDVDVGTSYNAQFVVSDASPFLASGERQVSNTSFEVVERQAWFDRTQGDENKRIRIAVNTGNVQGTVIGLAGGSTVAPGTKLLVTLRSNSEPFVFRNQTVTVQEGGEWLAEFRFGGEGTGLDPERRYVLKVRHLSTVISDRVTLVPEVQRGTPTRTTFPESRSGGDIQNVLGFVGLLVAVGAALGFAHRRLRGRDSD